MNQATSLIVQYLRDCHVENKCVTFENLKEKFHDDFQYRKRSTLTGAMTIAKRDYSILFRPVYGIGYEPLKQDIAGNIDRERMYRIKKQADLMDSELSTIAPQDLKTDEDVKSYVKAQIKCNAISQFVDEGVKKIDKKVEAVQSIGSEDWKGWMKQSLIELSDVS